MRNGVTPATEKAVESWLDLNEKTSRLLSTKSKILNPQNFKPESLLCLEI